MSNYALSTINWRNTKVFVRKAWQQVCAMCHIVVGKLDHCTVIAAQGFMKQKSCSAVGLWDIKIFSFS